MPNKHNGGLHRHRDEGGQITPETDLRKQMRVEIYEDKGDLRYATREKSRQYMSHSSVFTDVPDNEHKP